MVQPAGEICRHCVVSSMPLMVQSIVTRLMPSPRREIAVGQNHIWAGVAAALGARLRRISLHPGTRKPAMFYDADEAVSLPDLRVIDVFW